MHFCKNCENMYYIRLKDEDSDSLIYYCRKCGHEDDTLGATLNNICVSKTSVKKTESSVRHLVNEYTKLDPTLPRVNNIPCPNPSCLSNRPIDDVKEEKKDEKEPHEVIYLRYDDAALKFVYICSLCDKVWKSNDK
jgi:DNA-directed RNA polymerase subunit M/transcription elongation factor TFIIS